jgi:hypothetical protein
MVVPFKAALAVSAKIANATPFSTSVLSRQTPQTVVVGSF